MQHYFIKNSFIIITGYKVQVADTIGSGDAFLAGFYSQHVSGALPDASLDFACRIGAFVASKKELVQIILFKTF